MLVLVEENDVLECINCGRRKLSDEEIARIEAVKEEFKTRKRVRLAGQ